jgi:hypothetical protein
MRSWTQHAVMVMILYALDNAVLRFADVTRCALSRNDMLTVQGRGRAV